MDDLDRELLAALQEGFPLEADPYAHLAERAGCDADTAFGRVMALLEDGTIRRLGASFDSRRLGYEPTLVALRVPTDRVAEVAAMVSRHEEVTHNYERRGPWNLWFTVIAPGRSRIDEILAQLQREAGIADGDMMNLPVEQLFKIDVQFPTR